MGRAGLEARENQRGRGLTVAIVFVQQSNNLILAGAIPAAPLAILADMLAGIERALPAGWPDGEAAMSWRELKRELGFVGAIVRRRPYNLLL